MQKKIFRFIKLKTYIFYLSHYILKQDIISLISYIHSM